ncbi:MAG: NUDIX domain-containing protein [Flavobacteriales bacterium]|nr:NUDIX domain-containing protein [Flavobacteriales bacterium]
MSHEKINDFSFTKLPGGGLEFGEGPKDCVIREFKEETGLVVDVARHFYTTDFFVASAFDKSHQVISIYYVVIPKQILTLDKLFSLENNHEFEWKALDQLSTEDFTFPIDKRLVKSIKVLGEE